MIPNKGNRHSLVSKIMGRTKNTHNIMAAFRIFNARIILLGMRNASPTVIRSSGKNSLATAAWMPKRGFNGSMGQSEPPTTHTFPEQRFDWKKPSTRKTSLSQ